MGCTDPSPDSWRAMLADCWDAAATRRSQMLPATEPEPTARWARWTLAHADVAVRQRIDAGQRAARWELISSAADALEACAASWEAFGPVAGPRRLELVRALERRLAEHERLVFAAEADHRLVRAAVAAPARSARLAIERLHDTASNRGDALVSFEEHVVAFAAMAIRAARNIDATGRASGPPSRAASEAVADLRNTFEEVSRHARTLLDPRHPGDLAAWLSESLIVAGHASATGAQAASTGAGAARTGACDRERRRWLRLGARELLIGQELSQRKARAAGVAPSEIVPVAARVLADTGLAVQPDAFDPDLAWARQADALNALIPLCGRAIKGDLDARERARRILAGRLARVLLALWLLDRRRESTA
jgi:hypothetical protein